MNSKRPDGPLRVSQKIYRWLLKAYPVVYRREWAESMEQLFRDCATDAFSGQGYMGLARLWIRTLFDYAVSLVHEYRRSKKPRLAVPAAAGHPMRNFTPRAQQALALARQEAERLGHNYVGTEHILLGIIAVRENVGVTILKKMGVDPIQLRDAVEKRIGRGSAESPGERRPFAPRVKKALVLAGKEAVALGHGYLGCEHILIGLTLTEEGLAQIILQDFGVNASRCHKEIRQVFPAPSGRPPWLQRVSPERRDPMFGGEGRWIRQNATENLYGHVRLNLILVERGKRPPILRVTFNVTEKNFPNDQWAVIQLALQEKWKANALAFADWSVVIEILDGSWQKDATPAFQQATLVAFGNAFGQAAAAGMLPGAKSA